MRLRAGGRLAATGQVGLSPCSSRAEANFPLLTGRHIPISIPQVWFQQNYTSFLRIVFRQVPHGCLSVSLACGSDAMSKLFIVKNGMNNNTYVPGRYASAHVSSCFLRFLFHRWSSSPTGLHLPRQAAKVSIRNSAARSTWNCSKTSILSLQISLFRCKARRCACCAACTQARGEVVFTPLCACPGRGGPGGEDGSVYHGPPV